MKARAEFIARKRMAKASRLLSIVDRNVRLAGMPMLAGKRGVAALEVFRLRDWAALARQNKVIPPSKEVIPLILGLVLARGEAGAPRQMPLRKATPQPFAAARKLDSA